ncbi:MAG: hypothetical protein GF308_02570 [Candidatus Heimdallarchaeota archaeon]|nr:hypothetical protein [Candidatus Heimdallarchaeota archaeon]
MRKIVLSIIIIGTVIITVGGGLTAYFLLSNDAVQDFQDFEEGLTGWVIDADVPMDPNNPGHEVNWSIIRVEDPSKATSGNHSLKLFIDGRQDDGVIWIEKVYQLKANTKYRISLSFQFYCGMDSFNTITRVVGYGNIINPEVEEDLVEGLIGSGEQAPEWKEYSRTIGLKTGSEGKIWVAVGMSVVWESEITHYLDDLLVEIT